MCPLFRSENHTDYLRGRYAGVAMRHSLDYKTAQLRLVCIVERVTYNSDVRYSEKTIAGRLAECGSPVQIG